jgi:hypothetical protein
MRYLMDIKLLWQHMRWFFGAVLVVCLVTVVAGCAGAMRAAPVCPIDRQPRSFFMHQNDDEVLDDHIYFSKEAASGGAGISGGGCGCN